MNDGRSRKARRGTIEEGLSPPRDTFRLDY
jgi:hypothetical protein